MRLFVFWLKVPFGAVIGFLPDHLPARASMCEHNREK